MGRYPVAWKMQIRFPTKKVVNQEPDNRNVLNLFFVSNLI